MRVSVITPTADRPVAFSLAERWMARQTRQPDEWIVADGGQQPVVCTMGQRHLYEKRPRGTKNFLFNLARGLEAATGDVIVWVEDDDWYGPTHVATLVSQLEKPGVEAAGDDLQQYYNLQRRIWRTFNNRGASLCQTSFTRALVPTFQATINRCLRTDTFGVDGFFWAVIPHAVKSLERHQTVIGVKGLPGNGGLGIGHRPVGPLWRPDPHGTKLREWVGADAMVYEALMPQAQLERVH